MPPFFGELVVRTDEARRAFETHPVVIDAVANGMTVERYRRLLLELYQVVWHFNPICAAAASRITDEHRRVRYFLYEHMQEEQGHEEWVANDLDAVGLPRSDLQGHRPAADTLAMTGYNYWSAERRNPCSVLGMLYALEVIASVYGGPFATAMRESLLLEDSRGISFIDSHSTLDAKHIAELREILNTIADTPSREAIIESVELNFSLFTRIFAAI